MKPLTEWTDEDLREALCYGGIVPGTDPDFLAELLRRERERCAAVCDAIAREWHDIEPGRMAAEECADHIRELKGDVK